jgi:hypothetical protein
MALIDSASCRAPHLPAVALADVTTSPRTAKFRIGRRSAAWGGPGRAGGAGVGLHRSAAAVPASCRSEREGVGRGTTDGGLARRAGRALSAAPESLQSRNSFR